MWMPTDDEIKYYKLLAQDTAPNEEYYRVMLPLLLEEINREYRQKFKPSDLPANVKIFIAKAAHFLGGNAGLKSRKMGSVSYTFNFNEFPGHLMGLLAGYRKVKYHVL